MKKAPFVSDIEMRDTLKKKVSAFHGWHCTKLFICVPWSTLISSLDSSVI